MDELKLRLEYLEHVSKGSSEDQALLKQVDDISATFDEMLSVRKQEVHRMADEFNKKQSTFNVLSEENGPGKAEATQLREDDKGAEEGPSTALKEQIVASRFNDLLDLANELESQGPFEVPDIAHTESVEERARNLEKTASELGQEFDELTKRSTELTKRLMDQLSAENEAVADAQNAHD